MPEEAIKLFDKVTKGTKAPLVKSTLAQQLVRSHWIATPVGNATLLSKKGIRAVFLLYKVKEPLSLSHHRFLKALAEANLKAEDYPHLPQVYRQHPGILLLEDSTADYTDDVKRWKGIAHEASSHLGNEVREKDLHAKYADFFQQHPTFVASIRFIKGAGFRVSEVGFIHQRADSTIVLGGIAA